MVHEIEIQPHLLLTILTESPSESRRRGATHLSALARECGSVGIRRLTDQSSPDAIIPPIGRGALGEPLFPTPFQGSLAHTPGWACALVTNDPGLLSVGVDIEALDRPFRPAVAARIANESERMALAGWHLDEALAPHWRSGLALFCAKEAAIKALSPLLSRPLVLSDISLVYTPQTNRFDLSAEAIFAQPLHGYIMTWHGALIAYAVVSTASTTAPLTSSV